MGGLPKFVTVLEADELGHLPLGEPLHRAAAPLLVTAIAPRGLSHEEPPLFEPRRPRLMKMLHIPPQRPRRPSEPKAHRVGRKGVGPTWVGLESVLDQF